MFTLRVHPRLRAEITAAAKAKGCSLTTWIESALAQSLERSRVTKTGAVMTPTVGLETESNRIQVARKVRRILQHCDEIIKILSEVDATDVAALLIMVGSDSSLAALDQAAQDLARLRDLSR